MSFKRVGCVSGTNFKPSGSTYHFDEKRGPKSSFSVPFLNPAQLLSGDGLRQDRGALESLFSA